jgi:hypothetical protein
VRHPVLRHDIVIFRVLDTAPISILIKLKLTGNSMSGGKKGKQQALLFKQSGETNKEALFVKLGSDQGIMREVQA